VCVHQHTARTLIHYLQHSVISYSSFTTDNFRATMLYGSFSHIVNFKSSQVNETWMRVIMKKGDGSWEPRTLCCSCSRHVGRSKGSAEAVKITPFWFGVPWGRAGATVLPFSSYAWCATTLYWHTSVYFSLSSLNSPPDKSFLWFQPWSMSVVHWYNCETKFTRIENYIIKK